MKSKSCVIVLGMHRSGTSALTRYMCDIGFSLPSDPLPSHPQDNPGGYWESRDVVMLNHRIMDEIGSGWKDVNPFPTDYLASSEVSGYHSAIDELLGAAFNNSSQIVLKDPRLCRLLPLWLPILNDYCDHLAVISIVREAESVYQSLNARQLSTDITPGAITDRNHAFALWLRYNLEAEFHSLRLPRHVVAYERWLQQPKAETRKIDQFLGDIFPEAKLSTSKPQLISPRHTDQKSTFFQNDNERIVAQVYEALVDSRPGAYLDTLFNKLKTAIPSHNQAEVEPPSMELISAAQLKHICGSTPCKLDWFGAKFKMDDQKRPVVYVSDMVSNPCHIYRVKNAVDALNSKDIPSWWTTSSELVKSLSAIRNARLVVIHRSQWNEDIASIYDFCRGNGISTASDIDDLIYEPDFIDTGGIRFIAELNSEQKRKWKEKVSAFRRTLLAADKCIVSTPTISADLAGKGIKSICVPNGFSSETLDLSSYWSDQFQVLSGANRLGYASGSPTHAADFALIASPAAQFLSQHPNWKLTIIGSLDFSEYMGLIDDSQLEFRPLVDHVNLAYELCRLSINLIPLERSPFCDAKSPLKWYEAALCSVPSIATKNPMYTRLLCGTNSGLVAESEDDWLEKITSLASNTELRDTLAVNARRQSIQLFHPDRMAEKLDSIC
jgi:glycosyltransferase involved in cell wall biosynthesis